MTDKPKSISGKTALQAFADFLALSAGREEPYEITCSETTFVIRRISKKTL